MLLPQDSDGGAHLPEDAEAGSAGIVPGNETSKESHLGAQYLLWVHTPLMVLSGPQVVQLGNENTGIGILKKQIW